MALPRDGVATVGIAPSAPPARSTGAVEAPNETACGTAFPNLDPTEAAKAIHRHCGVFTRPDVARIVLDAVGWTAREDLRDRRLLEPACGDGSFLVPAAASLLDGMRRRGVEPSDRNLRDAVVAFEFDEPTAERARGRLRVLLEAEGLSTAASARLSRRWVRCEDFLLATDVGDFTDVVGNPPYMRWSKVPRGLRDRYEEALPRWVARGDLCLPFLWRAVELSEARSGRVAFLCADRWLRCAYGERVRAGLAGRVRAAMHVEVHEADVFSGSRRVNAYAAVTLLDRRLDEGGRSAKARTAGELRAALAPRRAGRAQARPGAAGSVPRPVGGAAIAPPHLSRALEILEGVRLAEAGVTVRCGLALGHSGAFVVDRHAPIEADRLVPFVRSRDVRDDGSAIAEKRLLNVWAADSGLVRLADYPLMRAHLEAHAVGLANRSCAQRSGEWFRTIDRLRPERVREPKILVAGMAKTARVALSAGNVQPSNALYSLTSSGWPLHALFALLRSGILDVFAAVFAPTFAGGSRRYDGNVLARVRIPRWDSVASEARRALDAVDVAAGTPRADVTSLVYGLSTRERRRVLERAMLAAR